MTLNRLFAWTLIIAGLINTALAIFVGLTINFFSATVAFVAAAVCWRNNDDISR